MRPGGCEQQPRSAGYYLRYRGDLKTIAQTGFKRAVSRLFSEDPLIKIEIIVHHFFGRKLRGSPLVAVTALYLVKHPNRFNCFVYVSNKKSCFPVFYQLGHGAPVKGDHRGTAKHRLGDTHAKWLFETYRMQ